MRGRGVEGGGGGPASFGEEAREVGEDTAVFGPGSCDLFVPSAILFSSRELREKESGSALETVFDEVQGFATVAKEVHKLVHSEKSRERDLDEIRVARREVGLGRLYRAPGQLQSSFLTSGGTHSLRRPSSVPGRPCHTARSPARSCRAPAAPRQLLPTTWLLSSPPTTL